MPDNGIKFFARGGHKLAEYQGLQWMLARTRFGREDDAATAVGDHAAVELVQRIGDEAERERRRR